MTQFPSARHLASWAGICPGNDRSAGKRRSGRTRRSYYSAQHRRLTARRGVKRATVAVAHSLLVTVHCLLSRPAEPYADLGAGYFEKLDSPERQAERMVRKLQRLGYAVELKRPAA